MLRSTSPERGPLFYSGSGRSGHLSSKAHSPLVLTDGVPPSVLISAKPQRQIFASDVSVVAKMVQTESSLSIRAELIGVSHESHEPDGKTALFDRLLFGRRHYCFPTEIEFLDLPWTNHSMRSTSMRRWLRQIFVRDYPIQSLNSSADNHAYVLGRAFADILKPGSQPRLGASGYEEPMAALLVLGRFLRNQPCAIGMLVRLSSEGEAFSRQPHGGGRSLVAYSGGQHSPIVRDPHFSQLSVVNEASANYRRKRAEFNDKSLVESIPAAGVVVMGIGLWKFRRGTSDRQIAFGLLLLVGVLIFGYGLNSIIQWSLNRSSFADLGDTLSASRESQKPGPRRASKMGWPSKVPSLVGPPTSEGECRRDPLLAAIYALSPSARRLTLP